MTGVGFRVSSKQGASTISRFVALNSSQIRKASSMPAGNIEQHRTQRIGWLRAAVLGANDGILSTSSLVLGVAAAHASHRNVLVAGVAALVAGSMSMAAGEYVSVHSQADTEQKMTRIAPAITFAPPACAASPPA